MKLREVSGLSDWRKIKKLYMQAFPASERKPFFVIKRQCKRNLSDVLLIEDNKDFIGLAITMNGEDIVLLDYYAIDESKRSKGYGAAALKLLQEKYSRYRFFLETEIQDETADNAQERKRRKAFYLRNGMRELNIYIKLFGVDMELLGYNDAVTFEDYKNLYINNLGEKIAQNVQQNL